mmetsp:Transcript_19931/g.46082  ORF Transcript_19931/g.46082 Transcript_19931/m.46082 type:complete len:262 (-) Transcript_19931:118-903(-)
MARRAQRPVPYSAPPPCSRPWPHATGRGAGDRSPASGRTGHAHHRARSDTICGWSPGAAASREPSDPRVPPGACHRRACGAHGPVRAACCASSAKPHSAPSAPSTVSSSLAAPCYAPYIRPSPPRSDLSLSSAAPPSHPSCPAHGPSRALPAAPHTLSHRTRVRVHAPGCASGPGRRSRRAYRRQGSRRPPSHPGSRRRRRPPAFCRAFDRGRGRRPLSRPPPQESARTRAAFRTQPATQDQPSGLCRPPRCADRRTGDGF